MEARAGENCEKFVQQARILKKTTNSSTERRQRRAKKMGNKMGKK
jgi:hypothetical protein